MRIIYSLSDEVSTGDLYDIMRREVNMSYRKYYEILEKLERLRLIDVAFGTKGKGKTRYVYKKYNPKVVEKALKEF